MDVVLSRRRSISWAVEFGFSCRSLMGYVGLWSKIRVND
jgi:hypothetical protein